MKVLYSERNKGSNMFVLNIKSRKEQTPKRYVEIFDNLLKNDPLVRLRGDKHISMEKMYKTERIDKNGIPYVIYGSISTYDLLDPTAFYDRRRKENVKVSLGPDIVANKKDADFYFVPNAHRLAFSGEKVTLNQIFSYFNEAINTIEGEYSVDVNIEKSRDIINRILSANKLISLKADITFSNKDFSDSFVEVFDSKLKESASLNTEIKLVGTNNNGLHVSDDGIVKAIIKTSESNGSLVARISEGEKGRPITINTKDYPRRITVNPQRNTFIDELYNVIMTIFRPEK